MIRRAALAFSLLLSLSARAFALNPALDVSQYAHTAWRIREGFPIGTVKAIAQTRDGYLWLGTEFGLLRFDGVRNVAWQPPPKEHLPSNSIWALLAARDGTLWIGTADGLASWKDGQLTVYPQLAGQYVGRLLEDQDGAVWAGTVGAPTGRLCAIQKGNVRCAGEDGRLGLGVMGLYEDSHGALWVGVADGLWRWKPGSPEFHSLPGEGDNIKSFAEDDDGSLLFGTSSGIRRLVSGKIEIYPLPESVRPFQVQTLFRERGGALWIGTHDHGLLQLHQGRVDAFGSSDGLSADTVYGLFQDREGNIWVNTIDGLDRFHEIAVATFTRSQGSSNTVFHSVLATRDGGVWFASHAGLRRWDNGQIISYGSGGGELNGQSPNSLFEDDRGQIWISTFREFGYLENGRYRSVNGIPGGSVHAIAEDVKGNLWIANQDFGLFRLSARREVERVPWAAVGHRDHATALAADPLHGGLWIGFFYGGVVHFINGQVRAAYAIADGLGAGTVNALRLDPEGALWIATAGGLSRLKDGRLATLTSKNGLPCDGVHWAMRDDARSVWLNMPCGLVRIPESELKAWAVSVDKETDPRPAVQTLVFDSADGVRSRADAGGYVPRVAKSSDGKLWFTGYSGVSVVDPRHLGLNDVQPPVHIEHISADRRTYDAMSDAAGLVHLPALTRDLQIEYTALSLVAPEKNRFRIKLEGWDREWQDVGNRRQAFYNNLPPRSYRFRVIASNNSGVWNEAGASVDFSIAPAYYQTTWFRIVAVIAALSLLWAIYQFRLRRIAYEFDARLQERVNERTRIARELHDTLLQSFHGLLFRFQAATNMLPDRPVEAKQRFENAIDQAAQAITEGRDAVQNLRASTVVTNDLGVAISTLAEELAAAHHLDAKTSPTVVDVAVEGTPRDLHPILRDDIYRIAGEALRNAFRHAGARRIEVEIWYDDKQLQLRVRDDGSGIEPTVLAEERPGHFGIPGMRERAELVGGRLDVWSKADLGTEVELTIPAAAAYSTLRMRSLSSWFARRTGTNA